jgi:hypothetical protein
MSKVRYAMQDGRMFYVADSFEGLDADDCESYRSIIRVRDGDLDDAMAARHWFYSTIAMPSFWLIRWVHE